MMEDHPCYSKLWINSLHLFSFDWSSFISMMGKKKRKGKKESQVKMAFLGASARRNQRGQSKTETTVLLSPNPRSDILPLSYVLFLKTSQFSPHSGDPITQNVNTKVQGCWGPSWRLPTTHNGVTDVLNTHSVNYFMLFFLPFTFVIVFWCS